LVYLGHVLSLITRLCSIRLDTFLIERQLNLRNLVFTKNYLGGGGNVGIGVAIPGVSGLPGVPAAPPAAHTPLSSTGLSSHLLPGKATPIPTFPPPPK
jgi:hypothetical protein